MIKKTVFKYENYDIIFENYHFVIINKTMKYKKLKVGNYDISSGELLEGVIVLYGIKNNPYGNGWLMTSQEALKLIAKDRGITGETFRVFLYMLSVLDFENWIYISQKEIGEYLELKKCNVSRSVKTLVEKEIILKNEKLGKSYTFRLNPYFGWKGKVKSLEEYRDEKEKERIENLKNKVNKKRNKKIEILSKKYNIPIEELNYVYE